MKIKILPARREDIKIIQMLARTIWQEAYAKILSQAQIDYMLLQRYNENLLAEEFLAPHIFWDKVVDEDNEIMFRNGIRADKFIGINCDDESKRQYLLKTLHNEGIDDVNGVPIEKFVTVEDTIGK